jgi:hypothetical protein
MEKKLQLKQELLRRISEEENERVFLESQLAKVEKKELSLIKNIQTGQDPYELYLEKIKLMQ